MNTKISISILTGLLVTIPVFSQKKELGTIHLQHTTEGRMFEGIGALSAGASSRLLVDYPEKQQQDILDYLFKPKFGASLHHLKVEIGGDVNSTSGTEPSHARTREELENPCAAYYQRGYEWWLMKEAKKRNPAIFLDCLEWGAPGWIGDGKFYSQDNIDYMLAFLKGAKQYHQLDMDYIGIWNERMHDTEFIRNLRKVLDTNGLNHVKLVCSDLCCGSQWQIADDMMMDSALFEAVDVIGDHYPEREFNYQATPNALKSGKPLWNSEGGPWKGTWEGFCELAKLYNRDYIVGKMTKTITWSLITSYYDNLALPNSGLMKADSPWSGYYEVEPALWAVAHTTQFTEPGWYYLDQEGCGFLADSTVSYVTLRSPDKKDLSIIMESIDLKEPGSVRFVLPEKFTGNKLFLWRSVNQKETFVKQPDIRVRNGVFTLQVEPEAIYSITTTTGQQKGHTDIPTPAPFPFPYEDDFDNYKEHATPRYLSDQGGAFEVVTLPGVQGKVLKQQITRPAIEWEGAVINQTVWGDCEWTDYTLAVDVCLDAPYSYGCISGRVTETHRSHKEPEAYTLRLFSSGKWELRTAEKVLAKGFLSLEKGRWYNLKLKMAGKQIQAYIGNECVAGVEDETYAKGMAGLGCSFHHICFDNLSIRNNTSF